MIFCTVAGKEQTARATILAKSLKRHHPDARMIVGLAEHHDPAAHTDDVDELVLMTNHGIPVNTMESLSAVKVYFLHYLLNAYSEDVIYLDPYMKVYHSFDEVQALLPKHPIIAVPYSLEPCESDAAEIERLNNGILHAGFVALQNSDWSRRFTQWWRDRTAESYYRSGTDMLADRKWLTLGMVPFRIHVLRDPAYLAAFWNLQESGRRMSRSPDGTYTVGGKPLRSFYFTGQDAYVDHRSGCWSYDETVLINGLLDSYNEELEGIRQTVT